MSCSCSKPGKENALIMFEALSVTIQVTLSLSSNFAITSWNC